MRPLIPLSAALLVLYAATAVALDATPRRILRKAQPLGGDRFGEAVAIAGDRVLVGAPGEPAGLLANAGAAYLFDADTGALLHRFTKPSPAANDRFGRTVAFVGEDVVVGCPDDTANPGGALYRFDATTFASRGPLTVPPLPAGAGLGSSIAQVGVRLVAGAPHAAIGNELNAGKAFVFDPDGQLFNELQVGGANQRLGSALVALGEDVLLGLPGDSLTGKAYVMPVSGGITRIFPPSDVALAAGDEFGASLATVGSRVLIGSPFAGGLDAGAVYLFEANRTLAWKKTDPDDRVGDHFGWSVAGLGAMPVTGVPDAGQHGFVYLLSPASGNVVQTLSYPETTTASGQEFGYAIATAGRTLVVGAPDAGDSQAGGAVYLYTTCGDGTVDVGETCDDGNDVETDCCSQACLDTGFPCPSTTTSTSTTSTMSPLCGNHLVEGIEACDEGPMGSGCCSPTCTFRAAGTVCGTPTLPCEAPPACTGASPECPAVGTPRTGECRQPEDACAEAGMCDGASLECPPGPVVRQAGEPCRSARECFEEARCDGASIACPDNRPADARTPCTSDGQVCTDDVCDGAGVCAPVQVPGCQGGASGEAEVDTTPTPEAGDVIVVTCRIGGGGRKKGRCKGIGFLAAAAEGASAPLRTRPEGCVGKRVTSEVTKRVSDGRVVTLTLKLNKLGQRLLGQVREALDVRVCVNLRDSRGSKAALSKLVRLRRR